MNLDASRVAGLARTKLEALVRRAFPEVTAPAETFNAGVGIVHGPRAFVHLVDDARSPIGAALAWGGRRGATELHVVLDAPDPVVALQATGLQPPARVWHADGIELVAVQPAPLTDPESIEVPAAAAAQVPFLQAAGCDVVIEHGVVIGEILGLEVARVVLEADGSAFIRVGVGLYDQEAHALMHADASVEERLDMVVAQVRARRCVGVAPHPINRVARERWLRALVVDHPPTLGLDTARRLQPIVARGGIHEERPVAAMGTRGDRRVLVMTSTGIDLGLVPAAAGHVARDQPDEAMLILPERDHHDVIRAMAHHLAVPVTLASLPTPWS